MKYSYNVDLLNVYYQIKLEDVSKQLTTITTEVGTFVFESMSFSIKTASAAFQRIIETIVGNQKGWLVVYLDDILLIVP